MNSKPNKTPAEVKRAVSADLKRRGLTYAEVARMLGYKNKQTIANILAARIPKYLTMEQVLRFAFSFDYNPSFLMKGEGDLQIVQETDFLKDQIEVGYPFESLTPGLLATVINIAEGIIQTSNVPSAVKAWGCILHGDYNGYLGYLHELSENSGHFPVTCSLGRYACDQIKDAIEKPKVSGFLRRPDDE